MSCHVISYQSGQMSGLSHSYADYGTKEFGDYYGQLTAIDL